MKASIDDKKKNNGRGRGRPPLAEVLPREDGSAAFSRIAARRVNGIVDKLNTLAKLASGKSKYGYTDGDVEEIRSFLISAVNATADRLRRKPAQGGFKFRRETLEAGD